MKWYQFRGRIIRHWLTQVHDYSDARIKSGDIDLDDVYYKSRDASGTLLEKWFK